MGEYSRSLPGACHCWRQIKEHTPAIRMPLYWNKVSSHSAKGIRTDLKLPLDPAFAPFPKVDLCLIVFCHHINKFSRKDRMLMIGKRYKLSQEALILSVCWVSDLHCKISDLHSKIPLEKEIWKKVYFLEDSEILKQSDLMRHTKSPSFEEVFFPQSISSLRNCKSSASINYNNKSLPAL